METLVAKQLTAYFEEHDMFNKCQFGYRDKCCTIDAVTTLVEEIIEAFERKEYCVSTFCDLSKAFDMVSHEKLIHKLSCYGIRSKNLKFFEQYLTNRWQYVSFNGKNSELKRIRRGVPQGSVLGPLLFIIFLNDLGWLARLLLYADDTTLIIRDSNLISALNKSGNYLMKVVQWFIENEMILNEDKTQRMVFGMNVKETDEPVKYLGLTLDQTLTWRTHIRKLSVSLSKVIYLIRKLQQEVPVEVLRIMYFGLFHSKMAYGILLWGAAADASIIFKLQKKALRSIYGKGARESCREIFKEQGIMTLVSLFIYKHLLYVKEKNDVDSRGNRHNYNIRDKHNLHVPAKRLVKSEKAPSVMSCRIYNKLPREIGNLDIKRFKQVVHTFLIKHSFYNLTDYMDVNWKVMHFTDN